MNDVLSDVSNYLLMKKKFEDSKAKLKKYCFSYKKQIIENQLKSSKKVIVITSRNANIFEDQFSMDENKQLILEYKGQQCRNSFDDVLGKLQYEIHVFIHKGNRKCWTKRHEEMFGIKYDDLDLYHYVGKVESSIKIKDRDQSNSKNIAPVFRFTIQRSFIPKVPVDEIYLDSCESKFKSTCLLSHGFYPLKRDTEGVIFCSKVDV